MKPKTPIFHHNLGVSFSLHRCSELGIDKKALLQAALDDLGFRRFRLMSYWNIHEQTPGKYNFDELDWQLDMIAEKGGEATLCLGKRQPRWPECHIPKWAVELGPKNWYEPLYRYIEAVVTRYRNHPALSSWQLENEALLKSFGHCPDQDYNRQRLQHERELVGKLDTKHPLIMTLSDSWGLPWLGPRPDVYAMSMYRITLNKHQQYAYSKRQPWFYQHRAGLIWLLTGRNVFIHELQAEPWLAKKITDVPIRDQLRVMDSKILLENVGFAMRTGMQPIDLWGLEWWYWLKQVQSEPSLWNTAKQLLSSDTAVIVREQ